MPDKGGRRASGRRAPSASRRLLVAQRAGGCCEYCQSQERYSADSFAVEHIVPVSRLGTDDPSNLAFSCQGCNSRKYVSTEAFDPVTGEHVPLFDPRREVWDGHFAWNQDYTQILGLTPTGRATVAKLQLNRKGVVNLRKVLRAIGRHPPPR